MLPTIQKKTGNLREFLCKKNVGDIVFIPSLRRLISESYSKCLFEKENQEHREHIDHKNILNLVDTVSIKSVQDSIILHLNWDAFEERFGAQEEPVKHDCDQNHSGLNINMLRTVMESNLTDQIANMPLFSEIPHSKLEVISRFCHYSIEKKGSVICREGDIGNEVFILLSGEVKIEAKASKRMIELFNEGVLSSENNDRDANSSILLTSTGNEQEDIYCKRKGSVNYQCDYLSDNKSTKLSQGQKILSIRRKTLFQARDDYKKEKESQTKSTNGTAMTIASSHEPDNESLIPRLDLPDPNYSVELARLGPNDYFGEMATFIDLPRTATVTATTNVLMASLSTINFRNLYHVISPHLETSIEQLVKEHMIQTLFQSKAPFLEVLSKKHYKKISNLVIAKTYQEGTTIFHENDDADNFYFVYSGQVNLNKINIQKEEEPKQDVPQKVAVCCLYSGDYFGELALVNESKRRATAVASSGKTVVLELSRERFKECFADTPNLIAELTVRMKGNNVDLFSLLNHFKSKEFFEKYVGTIENRNCLKCHDEIQMFEQLVDVTEEDIKTHSTLVIDSYFKKMESNHLPNSLVTCASELVETFEKLQINGEQVSMSFFTEMKTQLYKYLENEIFPDFKETSSFLLLMEKMRVCDNYLEFMT